ncbi:hypothetical protein F5B22DRAFT_622100 [Xylaria bambusicola]|uniref:uncharacterized protein n=1 Tax=Xylaria bambusicola TaxID=326684 RepID=UPI00200736C3|nr:uncharacterized protein F5B22DRAFT_622100 [Xylaria bambusicola]KAI0506962.1 hypothetical protein F5B22DRAFT_622100 [Xylaria bambusicola]
MMLSRSGLSIRKLIPNRRLSDEDISGAELRKEENSLVSRIGQDGGGSIYAANRRSSRKKQAPAPIIATSPLTHSDVLRPLPPLPSETPRSSASSSCRCERHARCDCPLLNSRRRSPLYTISPKEPREEVTLISCVNSSDPDDSLTNHIPRSRFNSFSDATSKEEAAQASSPRREDKVETVKDQQPDGTLSPGLLSDVRQFMQETEDAFKTIGVTLSEVPVNQAPIFQTTKTYSTDVSGDIEPPPPTPPPKEVPVSLSKSPPGKAPSMFSSSPKSPPKDNPSSQVPKRKRSKKSKRTRSMRPSRKPTAAKPAAKSGPRWTLTENVSELLTGKLFHKIEVDEMLTPDQIEAFKQQRITKFQVDKMAEALEQELAGSILEPLHLDDFPSPPGSADADARIELPAEEKPEIAFSEGVMQRNPSFERQHTSSTPPIPVRHRPTFHKTNSSPNIPSRHVRSSSRKVMTELPIIPETSTTPQTAGDFYFSNDSNESLSNFSEYIYLPSPSLSAIAPTFQHGPIRLSKYDLLPAMKLSHDEDLDWTAFQMAISGGAGDLFSESDDVMRQREEEEVADIAAWWDSWHFESSGELVTTEYEASSPTSTLSGDEIPDLSYSEIDSDNQNSPHLKWQSAQHRISAAGLHLDLGFTKEKSHLSSQYYTNGPGGNANDDTWPRDGEQKQAAINRQSIQSLPPSPMLDLRVIRSPSGDDLDVVPMGYNLGHDLGDFLKWEAEHAFAGDFNSSPGLM